MLINELIVQGEASKIQNQEFYKSTLKAMRAKEDAKNAKVQQPIVRPGESPNGYGQVQGSSGSGSGSGSDVERPAVPAAKGKVNDGAIGNGRVNENGMEEMEEISIAGRTKMTVPKKDSSIQVQGSERVDSKEKEEMVDHTEAKSELNYILKRAPGMLLTLAGTNL